jgi:putative hydrolase of the HAD superfamily
MKPRAVLLDLDATLLDFPDEAWRDIVRHTGRLVATLGKGVDGERLATAYERISTERWADESATAITDGFDLWREHWRAALAEQDADSARHVRMAFHTYRSGRLLRYALYEDSLDTAKALRRNGFKLGLVTNGPDDTQQDKVDELGLRKLFNAVATSGELGIAKPDARIFTYVLDRRTTPGSGPRSGSTGPACG